MQAMATKVFVVDDDDAVRASLRTLLEAYGMEVEDYASTQDFLHDYRQRRMRGQCLVLDQHLPGVTGLDFLASEGAALDLPVILVTGRGDLAIRNRARALGAIGYFEKPVDTDLLITAIADAAGRA
jgi:two-component system response regulator FixJ